MSVFRALLLASVLGVTCVARAEPGPEPELFAARGLRSAEIERLALQLGSAIEAQRSAALRALSDLHEESLPGIAQRLRTLKKSRPDPDAARAALAAFRHAAGSRRADDGTDIAAGVGDVLTGDRSPAVLAMAEPLLLLRSLEGIASPEAGVLLADVLALDDGAWDAELRLARERMGLLLLPALIALRSHAEPRVRNFAQAGVRALGMEDPAVALKLDDPRLVAEVVRAYGDPLDYAAMPAIVRLVGSDKLEVREAARACVARFGKNAIWQLRDLYTQLAGKPADKSWDSERTARELYVVLDRDARAEEQRLLAQGMARFVAGDLDAMQGAYDLLLARAPEFAEREKLAPGYAALARKRFAEDKLDAARAAYARALRLAPNASDAEELRGELAYVDAELSLSHGVVDLRGYENALAHAPSHAAARDAHDRLSGARAARDRRNKRIAASAAIALLLALIAFLLRERSAHAPAESESAAGESS